MTAIHSSFYKGAKVRVIYKDGTQVITKFLEKLSDRKMKTEAGILNTHDMRSCNYYKPLSHERDI